MSFDQGLGLFELGALFDRGIVSTAEQQKIVSALGLAATRSLVLAGPAKAGKSTLLGQLAAAVSRGSMFLGEATLRGRVLLYCLDEPMDDAARRLLRMDGDPSAVIACDFPSHSLFVRQVESVQPALIVIDGLSDLLIARGCSDENDASAVARILREIVHYCRKHGAALIVLHHTRKGDGKIRGSTAVSAIFDLVGEFREVGPEDGEGGTASSRRVLHLHGRGIQRARLRLAFDGQRYTRLDSIVSFEARVAEVLADGALPIGILAERLGGKRSVALEQIAGLVARGSLLEERGKRASRLISLPTPSDQAVPTGGDNASALTHEPEGRGSSSLSAPIGLSFGNYSVSREKESRNTHSLAESGTGQELDTGTAASPVPEIQTHRETNGNCSPLPAVEGRVAVAPDQPEVFSLGLDVVGPEPVVPKAASRRRQTASTPLAKPLAKYPHFPNEVRAELMAVWRDELMPLREDQKSRFVQAFAGWFTQPEAERPPHLPTNSEVVTALREMLVARRGMAGGERLAVPGYAAERIGLVVEVLRENTADPFERAVRFERLLGLFSRRPDDSSFPGSRR